MYVSLRVNLSSVKNWQHNPKKIFPSSLIKLEISFPTTNKFNTIEYWIFNTKRNFIISTSMKKNKQNWMLTLTIWIWYFHNLTLIWHITSTIHILISSHHTIIIIDFNFTSKFTLHEFLHERSNKLINEISKHHLDFTRRLDWLTDCNWIGQIVTNRIDWNWT